MVQAVKNYLRYLFPDLHSQIWVLAAGRFLSLIGTGFTLFYAPIFFKHSVGLTAAAVGLGLGMSQVPGILGRVLGGTLSDGPLMGRRRTLLLSSLFCFFGSVVLAMAIGFKTFLLGSLIKGFGVGLFWPASEALVADLTRGKDRVEAYALNRMGDNLGLGIGVILGGLLIALTGAYRALFVIDAISFLVFMALLHLKIREPERQIAAAAWEGWFQASIHIVSSWIQAFRDIRLAVFFPINILFAFYMAQISSALPLQLSQLNGSLSAFSPMQITVCFTWYVLLTAAIQIPLARRVSRMSHPLALGFSALGWAAGFLLIRAVVELEAGHFPLALASLAAVSLATVLYTPSASALIADLAPESIRGVYTSINSLCWAIGYLLGPWLGGMAMDWPAEEAPWYWLALAGSTLAAIGALGVLQRLIREKEG
jgi:MFS family permease